MLVFDVTSEDSYIKIKEWIREIKQVVSHAIVHVISIVIL